MKRVQGPKLQHKVSINWSADFAYGIGLIASDGCLHKNRKRVTFSSKEEEMIDNFRNAFGSTWKTTMYARGGETEKRYFHTALHDKAFYQYLNSIGLTSAKSHTICSVNVPDEYFKDFLRGVFDGDGSIYTFWDKRWPNSFGYILTIASASEEFLEWLKNRTTELYGVKGFIRRGSGVYEIRYVKGDTTKLFKAMYHDRKALFLKRKYTKLRDILRFDQERKSTLECRGSSVV